MQLTLPTCINFAGKLKLHISKNTLWKEQRYIPGENHKDHWRAAIGSLDFIIHHHGWSYPDPPEKILWDLANKVLHWGPCQVPGNLILLRISWDPWSLCKNLWISLQEPEDICRNLQQSACAKSCCKIPEYRFPLVTQQQALWSATNNQLNFIIPLLSKYFLPQKVKRTYKIYELALLCTESYFVFIILKLKLINNSSNKKNHNHRRGLDTWS